MNTYDAGFKWDAILKFASSLAVISYLLIFIFTLHAQAAVVRPGEADRIFDKTFLQSVKKVLLYKQVVNIVGTPGVEVAGSSIKLPGVKYHWKGRNNSFFNVTVQSGKILAADVITPDGQILTLGGNGEVIDYGK